MKYRSELLYEYAKEHIRDQDVPPVFVPSYNRPDAKILQRLLVEPEFPIVLCIRREQEDMYSKWKGKCGFLLLDNVHDIAETRREIVKQISPHLNQAFMFDDDITELYYMLPTESAMKCSRLVNHVHPRWIDILKMWYLTAMHADTRLSISSPAYRPFSWSLKHCNSPIQYNSEGAIQCVLLNLENLQKLGGITYRDHKDCGNEDTAIQFDIMQNGGLTAVLHDFLYNCPAVNSQPGGCRNANGFSSDNDRYHWYTSCAKNFYGNHPGISYTKSRTGLETVKFNWKYWREKV